MLLVDTAATAALKSAASKAASALAAAPANATLALARDATAATYALSEDALTTKKVDVALLLACFTGIFAFAIGITKIGKVMNLMGPAVVSGFQTAAAVTIGLGQFKQIFGYGKDFTQSSHIDKVIQSFIDLQDTINIRATWSGWMWIAILLLFKQLGSSTFTWRGRRVLSIFKITGSILLCIIAIVATKLAELHLSPGCTVYNEKTGVSNIYFANATVGQWNVSSAPRDNPRCIPMPKSIVGSPLPLPWPRDRALAITGDFGAPPTGNVHLRWDYVDGKLLTGAIIITLVASLESIAIAKALGSRHRAPDLDPNKEMVALGLANFFGSFTGAYPLSGSFSRSALNDDVGATSPVAVLTVAVIVGIVLKIASVFPVFYYLPQNALSAIVVMALLNLLDVHHFLWLARHDRKDAGLWLTAFLAVLFQGVEIGSAFCVCALQLCRCVSAR
jgi:MFS superfamily sulfate permease-like transporter